jgi:hypothetical protein
MKKFYYDLHVFYSRKDGFSVPIVIEGEESHLEEEVIKYAVDNDLISDEDSGQVDSVVEIDEFEYNQMKGI